MVGGLPVRGSTWAGNSGSRTRAQLRGETTNRRCALSNLIDEHLTADTKLAAELASREVDLEAKKREIELEIQKIRAARLALDLSRKPKKNASRPRKKAAR